MKDELRQAIDTIPGFVWSALPDGSVDFLNQRWCDYTGVSLQDASGQGWQSAIHPEDRPQLVDSLEIPAQRLVNRGSSRLACDDSTGRFGGS